MTRQEEKEAACAERKKALAAQRAATQAAAELEAAQGELSRLMAGVRAAQDRVQDARQRGWTAKDQRDAAMAAAKEHERAAALAAIAAGLGDPLRG